MYVDIMNLFSALKKNEVMSFIQKWVLVENNIKLIKIIMKNITYCFLSLYDLNFYKYQKIV